jgi:hypothetical protein
MLPIVADLAPKNRGVRLQLITMLRVQRNQFFHRCALINLNSVGSSALWPIEFPQLNRFSVFRKDFTTIIGGEHGAEAVIGFNGRTPSEQLELAHIEDPADRMSPVGAMSKGIAPLASRCQRNQHGHMKYFPALG